MCSVRHSPTPSAPNATASAQFSKNKLSVSDAKVAEEAIEFTPAYTVGKTGGPSVLALLSHDLVPVLQGEDPRSIEQLWDKMWWAVHYVGRGGIAAFAMSAVDIALWDVRAKQAEQPLWRLLGGQDATVQAYAGGIDLQLPIDALRSQTLDNVDRGFRAIKMKVGREHLREDIQRVAAVRDVLGADTPLMVDANMRWTVDEAICAAQALAAYDVYWLEEPTLPEDFSGHRRIREQGGLPVASGENLRSVDEFQKLIAAGGVSYPEPDVSNIGGVTAWMQVARLAEAHNLPVTSHGVHDLHVHLLAAVPNASFVEVHGFGLEPFLREPLTVCEGLMRAPSRPGHGVEFDWNALQPHRV